MCAQVSLAIAAWEGHDIALTAGVLSSCVRYPLAPSMFASLIGAGSELSRSRVATEQMQSERASAESLLDAQHSGREKGRLQCGREGRQTDSFIWHTKVHKPLTRSLVCVQLNFRCRLQRRHQSPPA